MAKLTKEELDEIRARGTVNSNGIRKAAISLFCLEWGELGDRPGDEEPEWQALHDAIVSDKSHTDIPALLDHIEELEAEAERLREKHADEIDSLCGVVGQTACALKHIEGTRAIKQVAINALCYHNSDWLKEYDLE